MAYPAEVWKAIRKEWIAGQLSLAEIHRNYGPTRQAILKRAKTEAWPARGTLADEVRREINTALASDTDPEKVTQEVTPDEQVEIIEAGARRGLTVVRGHRNLITRLLSQVKVTLDDLEAMQRFSVDELKKMRLAGRSKLVATMITARISASDDVSKVLARVIPLERQAYQLDTEKGEIQSIKYVISEPIEKPPGTGLSEDDWEQTE